MTILIAALVAAPPASASLRSVQIDAKGNPIPSTAASFDCSKAKSFAEMAICANVDLAMADRGVAETYERLLRHDSAAAAIRIAQRDWLKTRNACTDRTCVASALNERWRTLNARLDAINLALRARVQRVGECEETHIDSIGPRLDRVQGEAPDGVSIGYANGVSQVSYDRAREILKSQVGDLVRVCLVSVPKHCPRGDDRGRVYSALNLRTKARWQLPDSEHSCGGA